MSLHLQRIIGMTLPSLVGLLYASTARADPLSHTDFLRGEFAFSYVVGDANRALGTRVPYTGALGGLRVAGAKLFGKWIGYEVDFQALAGGIDDFQGNLGLSLAVFFAPLQWKASSSGSLVFGVGLAGDVGRPMWMPVGISANALAFTRLMVLPTAKTRLQIEYRITPISTHLLSNVHWVVAHEADISFGKGAAHFGVRGRLESASPVSSLFPGSSGTYRTWWLGPFIAYTER
jgi:hypothetical protein